jgi:hypothetical protein
MIELVNYLLTASISNQSINIRCVVLQTHFLDRWFLYYLFQIGFGILSKKKKNKFGNDKEKERIGLNYWAECLSLFNSDSRKNYWASVPKNLISLQ